MPLCHLLSSFSDLVIWGNEHESQPQLMESLVGTYRILQPGSSVATSLSAGESSLCPKHMALFEIKEKKFRMKPLRYRQVRQFQYDELSLKDYPHLDAAHPKVEDHVKDVVSTKLNEMILEGRAAVEEPLAGAHGNPAAAATEMARVHHGVDLSACKFRVKDPQKILVRLRVDHEGFPPLNHQRFGAQFVGEVANAADVLLLAKKRKEVHRLTAAERAASAAANAGVGGAAMDGRDAGSAQMAHLQQMIAEGAEEEIQKIRIEDLVNETLLNSRNSLGLLVEAHMAEVHHVNLLMLGINYDNWIKIMIQIEI